jgi:hypothetical protein
MDTSEPRRRRSGRARDRQFARKRQHDDLVALKNEAIPTAEITRLKSSEIFKRGMLILGDIRWYILHEQKVWQIAGGVFGIFFLLFVAAHWIGGRAFPNVWSLGINIGDMNQEEAQAALQNAWDRMRIALTINGETVSSASPAEMGLLLDIPQTFEAARAVGLSGIPLGYGVTPVVSVDYVASQEFFLNLTNGVEIAPSNASYAWQGTQLVGVSGSEGRAMDVMLTLDTLQQNPASVVEQGRFSLQMAALTPETTDPSPFLEDARTFISQPLVLNGYDPYRDESMQWSTTLEVQASWLEVTREGLTVREDVFNQFITQINTTLNPANTTEIRYVDPAEAKDLVSTAINGGQTNVLLRIRYQRASYEVQSGDTGYGIGRRTGIPYNLIAEQNTGRNMDQLLVGDTIYLPSRDVTLPLLPIAHKRIVVNIETQSLIAFENGEVVFNWLISSGMDSAPTYPGVFQILSHDELALGSSYTLCSADLNCGTWQMNWFMGVYEVVPGLMNGFHGGVLLPGGNYLGGGNVGSKYTFGCIMSVDSQAQQLYEWAEEGTVVEIISRDYAPQSDLAREWLRAGGGVSQ